MHTLYDNLGSLVESAPLLSHSCILFHLRRLCCTRAVAKIDGFEVSLLKGVHYFVDAKSYFAAVPSTTGVLRAAGYAEYVSSLGL
jgi:hypothetical protein